MAIIFSLLLMYSGVAWGKGLTDTLDQIVQTFAKTHGFQGNVAIQKNDQLIFAKSYGDAVVEFHVPNQADTKFRIGSLTKQFTAAAILLLQEDGKLDVQQKLNMYMTVPAAWVDITIHELLTHSAGLNRDAFLTEKDSTNFHSLTDLIQSAEKDTLAYQPGQKTVYSNVGYTVLASVIETLSGASYGDFLKQRIFSKLDMNDTGEDRNDLVIPNRAKGYFETKGKIRVACCLNISNVAGAGDLYSTTADLLTWDKSLYTDKILSDKSREAMFTANKQLSGGSDFGYGAVIDKWKGHTVYWHNGEVFGYQSDFSRYPESKMAIVILSNHVYEAGHPVLLPLRRQLASAVLEESNLEESNPAPAISPSPIK